MKDETHKTDSGNTLIQAIITRDDLDMGRIRHLLEQGADPNEPRSTDGSTAVMAAATRGNPDLLELLLAAGGNVNARSHHGGTALMDAAMLSQVQAALVLLQAGAEVNARNDEGRSVLQNIVPGFYPDSCKMARLLLAFGADPADLSSELRELLDAESPERAAKIDAYFRSLATSMQHSQSIRDKFVALYGPLADKFFEGLKSHLRSSENPLTEKALRAVSSMFFPCYGKFYENQLVKIACMGESTLGWGNNSQDNPCDDGPWDNLWVDLVAWERGEYDLMFGNKNFQMKGPSSWRNNFWQYHAAALGALYHREEGEALGQDSDDSFFSGMAWGNCLPIEPYKTQDVNQDAISEKQCNDIVNLAVGLRISGLEHFIHVLAPDVIIYTCHNNTYSNAVFPEGTVVGGDDIPYYGAVIKVWKYKGTLIFQTQHPTWLKRWKGVSTNVFGKTVAEALRQYGCFPTLPAPENGEIHYNESNITPDIRDFFVLMLNRRAQEYSCGVSHESMDGDFLKELSYRLMLALALELRRQNATMTAALMCALLNEVNLFSEKNWQYAGNGRGPCATAAGCWDYYKFKQQHEIYADTIAHAFTKKNGDYAWC